MGEGCRPGMTEVDMKGIGMTIGLLGRDG